MDKTKRAPIKLIRTDTTLDLVLELYDLTTYNGPNGAMSPGGGVQRS